MSLRIPNTTVAPHELPTLADRALPVIVYGSHKGNVLLMLAALGVQSAAALAKRSGSVMNRSNFTGDVIMPLRDMGLVQRFDSGPATVWGLTRDGERMAERLQAMEPGRAQPAPVAVTSVAAPRGIERHEPMPKGEFRCMRPGAYDHEQWPSRQGNTRVYRNGRRVPVTD
jgi:hypothetical protein